MADPLSIGASALGVAATAVQAIISLRDAVERYRGRDKTLKRLLDELQDLINILNQLEQVAAARETSTVKLLGRPISRCSELCSEFEQAMKGFSGKSKTSLRDWTRMEFMRGDINTFIDTLGGYKSTITVALGTITMSTTRLTQQVLEDYHEMIKDTIYGLEIRLQRIENNMTEPIADAISGVETTIDLQDEMEVTKECLRVCEDARSHLEVLQNEESSLLEGSSQIISDTSRTQFEAQTTTYQVLSEARDRFAETIGRLQERLHAMRQNAAPESASERLRLQEDINIQRQCLEVCKRASVQVVDRKVHTFGELVADSDSDQFVVTTLADLFDVKKALATNNSAQLVGSMTEAALMKISGDRYSSRFGAVVPQVEVATRLSAPETRHGHTSPLNQSGKDEQLVNSEKRQNRPASNTVRKRTGEADTKTRD